MWISRERYNELINIEQHYEERVQHRSVLFTEAVDRIQILTKELEIYRSATEEYKQKYADEVQKRLELVKLLENTP